MVTPAPADLQVPRGEALALKARTAGECDRGLIARLDVGLEPVQAQLDERRAQHELDPLAHVTLVREPLGRRIAEVGALQRSASDLGDVEEADDLIVGRAAYEDRPRSRAARSPRGTRQNAQGRWVRSPTACGRCGSRASARQTRTRHWPVAGARRPAPPSGPPVAAPPCEACDARDQPLSREHLLESIGQRLERQVLADVELEALARVLDELDRPP